MIDSHLLQHICIYESCNAPHQIKISMYIFEEAENFKYERKALTHDLALALNKRLTQLYLESFPEERWYHDSCRSLDGFLCVGQVLT